MAINPVQPNIENKNVVPYREAHGSIKTDNHVHPRPAEGHLVHDTITSVPKFWIKDITYDIKAVKDGFSGKANDHQTGRLNDVGLKLGGIGIAAYLASRTTDPKKRIMEYVGLGSFLAAMSLYPKIAINAPSRIVQGYDIGKEYIDDQGRKKVVLQDPNYIPFDMYRGEYPGEDLDIIGDRMGIPRDIKNRNDLIKEQMRKIAIQNNTLWMLTAGFATPVMTALICCGLERVIAPAMEIARNAKYNSQIASLLNKTENMSLNAEDIEPNNLSRKISKILTDYKDKELPKADFDNIVRIISEEVDSSLAEGIKEDLEKIFKSEKNGFVLDEKFAQNLSKTIQDNLPTNNKTVLEKVLVPTEAEINTALKNIGCDKYLTEEKIQDFKGELKKIFRTRIEAQPDGKDALYMEQNRILEDISKSIKKNPSSYVSQESIDLVTDFAKILGDFKKHDRLLDKCQVFKVEEAPETVLAKSYGKFESTLLDVLDIKYKDLKLLKEEGLTKDILEKKIEALVKDSAKYEKAIRKLAKVMSDMEVKLHGTDAYKSHLRDLIAAVENNYNKTAQRLDNAGIGKFSKTIDKLIKQDVKDVKNSLTLRDELHELLDGTILPKEGLQEWSKDYAKEYSAGVGSSRDLKIGRIIDRYQGVNNTFGRIIHTLDFYKRDMEKAGGYDKELLEAGRSVLVEGNSSAHNLKFDTVNNPEYYKDIMRNTWGKGLSAETQKAVGEFNEMGRGNVLDRLNGYMARIKYVMGNNDLDFTKPEHLVGEVNMEKEYSHKARTRLNNFNLVAQNPVDMVKGAAQRRYNNQKWLRIASAIGGTVLAGTILAQFAFGKIKNPQNIQKQVSDDTNN